VIFKNLLSVTWLTASWFVGELSCKQLAYICLQSLKVDLRNDLYCVEWGVKLYSLLNFRLPSQ